MKDFFSHLCWIIVEHGAHWGFMQMCMTFTVTLTCERVYWRKCSIFQAVAGFFILLCYSCDIPHFIMNTLYFYSVWTSLLILAPQPCYSHWHPKVLLEYGIVAKSCRNSQSATLFPSQWHFLLSSQMWFIAPHSLDAGYVRWLCLTPTTWCSSAVCVEGLQDDWKKSQHENKRQPESKQG